MGYNVEFDRISVKIDSKWVVDSELVNSVRDQYISLSYIGDSNLRDLDGNMVKKWHINVVGEMYDVIRRLCDFAKETEGGMLKYQNGGTKPENYIKNWRETLNNAISFDQFIERHNPTLKRKFDGPEVRDEDQQNEFDNLRDLGWKKDEQHLINEKPTRSDFLIPEHVDMFKIEM